ncbi:MAG: single-stranded DNA-binding protein [Bacteroidaceae bacterium]|nr:single-stranded DNA-binding protein [Bacteroidaceae bacterium]
MSLNKVMLIGRLAEEPKVYYQNKGVPTVNLTLVTTTPGRTLPNGTVIPDSNEWHSIWLWDNLARIAEVELHRGDQLYIEGSLHTRSFSDRSGMQHKRAEIWATEMDVLWAKSRIQKAQQAREEASKQQSDENKETDNKIPF